MLTEEERAQLGLRMRDAALVAWQSVGLGLKTLALSGLASFLIALIVALVSTSITDSALMSFVAKSLFVMFVTIGGFYAGAYLLMPVLMRRRFGKDFSTLIGSCRLRVASTVVTFLLSDCLTLMREGGNELNDVRLERASNVLTRVTQNLTETKRWLDAPAASRAEKAPLMPATDWIPLLRTTRAELLQLDAQLLKGQLKQKYDNEIG